MKTASARSLESLITRLAFALLTAVSLGFPLRAQDFSVLHVFDPVTGDASLPEARMTRSRGNLYGTSGGGGAFDLGTVFKLNPTTGQVTVLYSFAGGADGEEPRGSLYIDRNHNFYGTTVVGGPSTFGTIFRLDASGQETVLYSFTGGTDGGEPYAGLTADDAGNLYGTTWIGGDFGMGVVFKMTAAGQFSVMHSFSGPDGAYAFPGPLVLDKEGNLYGTTGLGGTGNAGVVFKMDGSGNVVVLHNFTGGDDGNNPEAGLIRDSEGNLYGTTYEGGTNGLGTVFKLGPTGTESVLYSFNGGSADGKWLIAPLLRDENGHLFGTTRYGGTGNWGVVFELDEQANETVLHNFSWKRRGRVPDAGLVMDKNGDLYGSTSEGGIKNCGVLYKLTTKK